MKLKELEKYINDQDFKSSDDITLVYDIKAKIDEKLKAEGYRDDLQSYSHDWKIIIQGRHDNCIDCEHRVIINVIKSSNGKDESGDKRYAFRKIEVTSNMDYDDFDELVQAAATKQQTDTDHEGFQYGKSIYYHGTTLENAKAILKEGFKPQAVWECSNPLATYFYRSDIDGDPKESLRLAMGNAQIASAVSGTQDSSVAVIIADIPKSIPVYPDRSCENMENLAVEIETELLNMGISSGKIKIRMMVFPETYCPGMRFFYLKGLDFLDLSGLSDFETEIIQALSQINESDIDDMLLNSHLDWVFGSTENEAA